MAAKKIAKKPKKNGKTPKNGKANGNGRTAIRLAPSLKNGSTRTLLRQLAQGWELVSDAVSVTNPENDHLWYVNAGWRKLYGYTYTDALDQPVTLLNRDDLSSVQRRDIATNTKRGGWRGRLLNHDAFGNVFAVDLQTRPLKDADGELLYIEGYEDGSYIDLLELREYTDVRIQAVNEGSEFGAEPLQSGKKYLFTVGRTQNFFAADPSATIASCVRNEEDEIRIFPIFRPKTSN